MGCTVRKFAIAAALFGITLFSGRPSTTAVLAAQSPPRSHAAAHRTHATAHKFPATARTSAFESLRWRNIGPVFLSSRIDDLAAAVPAAGTRGLTRIFYAAGPGGLYKSTNTGMTWKSVFEHQPTVAVSAVAVAPSNENVVWAGTGSWVLADIGREVAGKGVFASLDGGRHWRFAGLADSTFISRIVIDPHDPRTVYVAVLGARAHASQVRGVYKTTDAGKTWRRTGFVNEWTGIVDLSMDPQHPQTLFAAAWQEAEKDGSLFQRGAGSGILRTTDGGDTWERLGGGLPRGNLGRIAVAISPSRSQRIYALVDDGTTPAWKYSFGRHVPQGGGNEHVFRSDDGGDHWIRASLAFSGYPEYYTRLCADPNDPARVEAISSSLQISNNSGKTLKNIKYFQDMGDEHACWIDPLDTSHLLQGDDTGVWQSLDRGLTWQHLSYVNGGLFYSITADAHQPFYRVFGAVQDYGGWSGPSRTYATGGIKEADWLANGLPEGGGVASNPRNSDEEYGLTSRYNVVTHFAENLSPLAALAQRDRAYFVHSPVLVSRFDAHTVYYAGQSLYKSTDAGHTWKDIFHLPAGPAPTRVSIMGTMMNPPSFASSFTCISAIAESPLSADTLYLGTTNGRLFVSTDAGIHWQRLPANVGAPARASVSSIALSRTALGLAYVSFSDAYNGGYAPYVIKTTDSGGHWTSIVSGLPATAAAWTVLEDARNPSLLFAATDEGVFASFNAGLRWRSLRTNMPAVRTYDIALQPDEGDLIAATWGRGVFVLDDIRPLEQYADALQAHSPRLFPIRDTVRFIARDDFGGFGSSFAELQGNNPPYGAPINYFVDREFAHRTLKVEIADSSGAVIMTHAVSALEGLHRITWDLADHVKLKPLPEMPIPVPPGTYEVRLKAGGDVLSRRTVNVVAEPDETMTSAEYALKFSVLRHSVVIQARAKRLLNEAQHVRKVLLRERKTLPKLEAGSADRLIARTVSVLARFYPQPPVYDDLAQYFTAMGLEDLVVEARKGMLSSPGPVTTAELAALDETERAIARLEVQMKDIDREAQLLIPKRANKK